MSLFAVLTWTPRIPRRLQGDETSPRLPKSAQRRSFDFATPNQQNFEWRRTILCDDLAAHALCSGTRENSVPRSYRCSSLPKCCLHAFTMLGPPIRMKNVFSTTSQEIVYHMYKHFPGPPSSAQTHPSFPGSQYYNMRYFLQLLLHRIILARSPFNPRYTSLIFPIDSCSNEKSSKGFEALRQ